MNATKTSAAASLASRPKRKGSAGKVRIIMVILIVLLVGGGAAWYFKSKTAQATAQAGAVTTTTATVERGDISLTASGSGTLVTNEAVNMSFSTSGKVAELNVKLGDTVKKGDVLAKLENAQDLEANLASAQANLLQAQQTLAQLQKSAGTTLAKAYQTLVTAQAAYNDALTESQRTEASTRCSTDVVKKYRTALEQATQKLYNLLSVDAYTVEATIAGYDYDTALANYSYCNAYTAREKTSAASTLEVTKQALAEAETNYNALKEASGVNTDTLTLDETKVETAQTQVTTAQETLDGITLKATIDGKITYLAATAGTIVDTSTFLTISDVSHPTVTVSLDESDMDKLVVGNSATVVFTALPKQTFTGKVSLANPQMNSFGPFRAATGQIVLDEEAVKTIETMPLGLSATIQIIGKEAKNVLIVPVDALKQLNSGEYVVKLVGSDGKLTQQVVSVGLKDDTSAEITAGLKEGDIVSVTAASSSSSSQEGEFMGGGMPPQ
jgi:HlyD family secretion protein